MIIFPVDPTPGQVFDADNGISYTWDGNKWVGGVFTGSVVNGTSIVQIPNPDGNVYITSNATETWTFGTDGNLTAPGDISTLGNITAGYFIGDGSQLTGLAAGYANANATAYGEAGWAGNIVPASSNVYSLGNSTNQWLDLYVSNTTIYINNVPIGLTSSNVLTVDGQPILSNDSATTINTTGNITADTVFGNIQAPDGNTSVLFNLDGVIAADPGFTYNRDTDLFRVGTVFSDSASFTGNPDTGSQGLYVGQGTYTPLGSTVMAQFTGNVADYAQINLQNVSDATNASADYIITADNGTDTTFFVDLGMTSSNWDGSQTNSLGGLIGPDTGYLYVQDGALAVGTKNGGSANVWTFGLDGNLAAPGTISTAGDVVGGDVYVSSLASGEIAIAYTDGKLVGGIDLMWDFANAKLWTTGLDSNGAVTTSGTVSAGGNVTGGNIVSNGFVSAQGNVILNSNNINNVADPFYPQDAATKNYVDTVAQGLHIHAAAYLATTTDLATYTGATVTYSQPNGYGNGVNATLSLTGNTLTDLDGVTLVGASSDTRLLIKNEGNAVYNGIYTYTTDSVLTRATDADVSGDLDGGDFIFVQAGNTQADTGWAQTTDNVVIGTSNIVFTQFSGAGTYKAGNGLTLTGEVFSVNVDNTTTQIVSGNVAVKDVPVANVTGLDAYLAAYSGDISTTGNITGGNITSNNDLSVSGNIISLGTISGTSGSFTGNIDLNNYWVNNVADPVDNQDAATKYYVDSAIAGSTQMVQSSTPPASPAANTLWWDTVSGRLYLYYDDGVEANWIDASPAAVQLTYAAGNNLTLTNNTFSLANNISVSGNVTANAFIGDGSQLTGTLSQLMGAAQITPTTPVTSSVTVPANSANVDINTDTIFVTNTFTNGQAVTYNANGGTVMGGLGDGRIYYIGNATGTSFQLYDNAKNALLGGSSGRKNITGLGNSLQTFGTSNTSIIVNYDATTGNTVFVQSATANTVATINGDFDVNLSSGQALRFKIFIAGSSADADFTAASVNGNPVTGFTLSNGIKRNVTNNINATIVNFGGTYTIYNG